MFAFLSVQIIVRNPIQKKISILGYLLKIQG